MKKTLLLIVITVSTSGLTFGQRQKAQYHDSTFILKLENDWAKALINRDKKLFNQLLAADFFYTENEKLYSRSEVIQSMMAVSDTVEGAYNEGMQVHLKGKTAIATGWLFVNGKSNGAVFKRKYRYTDIWFNEKGIWQLIAAHDYLLP